MSFVILVKFRGFLSILFVLVGYGLFALSFSVALFLTLFSPLVALVEFLGAFVISSHSIYIGFFKDNKYVFN